jgi:CHAT domain-containing protein
LQFSLSTFLLVDWIIDQMRWRLNEDQSRMFWRERTRKWYALAVEACHLLQDVNRGFYFFEKSRSVLLNDKLNELNASSRLSKSDFDREQSLRVKLFSSQQKLAEVHPNTAEYGRIQQVIYENQRSLDEFIHTLEKKYPLYYQYRYDRSIPDLADVIARLGRENRSLISYFNVDESLYAMVIKPDSSFLQRIEYPDYRRDFDIYLQQLSAPGMLNKNFASFRKLGNSIYDKIIKPFNFTTESLVVIHDDVFIPIEALVVNQEHVPHFLVEDFVISYSYSVSFLFNTKPEATRKSSVLAMAPVEFSPSLSQVSLRGSDDALRKMREFSFAVTYLTGNDATRKEFAIQSKQFDIVHLLTHADHQSKGEPVLFFSDSLLKVSDLQMFGRGKTKLISLFACHTASGKTISGEGTYSLARGFAAAGIPSTITTLWALDNEATYKLAEYFYRNVYKGMATDKALRQAKVDLIKSDQMYSLPYYWAGTVLIGPSQQFQFKDDSSPFAAYLYVVTVVGLVIVAFAGVFFVRRRKMRKPSAS